MFGFRARVNFEGTPKETKENTDQPISGGTYRAYREEFYGNGSLPEPPKKITPSMIKLPGVKETSTVPKPPPLTTQSVPDLTQAGGSSLNITRDEKSKSTVNIAQQPQQTNKVKISPKDAKNQEKELKKLEKQRQAEQKKQLAEQKKRDAAQKKLEKKQKEDAAKAAKQQAAREAKLKKEREKALKDQNKKDGKKAKPSSKPSSTIPPPPKMPSASKAPGVPEVRVTNPLGRANPLAQVSTNTIDSSISRSSGPPPYTDKVNIVPNKSDNTGNTSFSKPAEEENSWDFISQHRQQMSRPTAVNPMPRKKGGNLEYNVGNAPKLVDGGNSEA